MKIEIETEGQVTIVRLSGRIGPFATGRLCDVLVAEVQSGADALIVEFAPDAEVSRPSVRGLVVAASLMRASYRPFGIVAGPELGAYLHHVSFQHLLPVDPDRTGAMRRMGRPPVARTSTDTTSPANTLGAPRRPAAAR